MRKLLIAMVMMLTMSLSGCATFTDSDSHRLAIQYGTLKIIERDNGIDRLDVLDAADRLEEIMNTSSVVVAVDLRAEVLAAIRTSELSVADRFLVLEVINGVEETLFKQIELDGGLTESTTVKVQQLISYIRQAANIS